MFGSLVRWLGFGAGSGRSEKRRPARRAGFTLGFEALGDRAVPASLRGVENPNLAIEESIPSLASAGISRGIEESIPSLNSLSIGRGEAMPAGQFTGGVEIAGIRRGEDMPADPPTGDVEIDLRSGETLPDGGVEIAPNLAIEESIPSLNALSIGRGEDMPADPPTGDGGSGENPSVNIEESMPVFNADGTRRTGEEMPAPAPPSDVEIAGIGPGDLEEIPQGGTDDMAIAGGSPGGVVNPQGQGTGDVEIAGKPGGSGVEVRQGQSTGDMTPACKEEYPIQVGN